MSDKLCYKLDKWNRKVGIAKVDGLDVCLEQIRRGLAVHFKKYQREQRQEDPEVFSAAEDAARAARVGLWEVRARSEAH